jgi:pilus assembly protein Flp/PilA
MELITKTIFANTEKPAARSLNIVRISALRAKGGGVVVIVRKAGSTQGGQRGQGMVEYALILVLVSIVVIVILLTMGNQIANVFSNVVAALG